jgi:8-oxo-dGTP pyrophosphatase MutT (NUDIX family)
MELLGRHRPADAREAEMLELITRFTLANPRCLARSNEGGHITASAWVLDHARAHALLVFHARLEKWLQPGGHIDAGDADVLSAARRETLEETGLHAQPVHLAIFDVDAHPIPGRKREPAHTHYDIRFLLEARRDLKPVVSPESRDVRWVRLEEVAQLNTDHSVTRLVEKTRRL